MSPIHPPVPRRPSPNLRRHRRRLSVATLLILWSAAVAVPVLACDICAVYTATEMPATRTGFRFGLAEQFSRFTTLQDGGREVANPHHERLESSITQPIVGYTFSPRFGVQLNLPIISRNYRRVEASGVVNGDTSGVGDLSLLGTGVLYSHTDERSVFHLHSLLGVKLPTGSARRLREEVITTGSGGDDTIGIPPVFQTHLHPYHLPGSTAVRSGIHGHDLALGSGSTDLLLGVQGLATHERWFATAALQYTVRTKGAYGYRYANELLAQTGPGFFALLSDAYSLGLQAIVTCDSKGNDDLNGKRFGDTAMTALYAGPRIQFTWGSTVSADIIADLPVVQNNSSLQLVPDFRLRGGLIWRL
jgi:hypothetical protein